MAVQYTQALLDRATTYLAKSVSERRYDEGLSEIAQLLSDITGEPNGGCRQCQYSDYFARVRAYINQATRFLHPEIVSTTTPTLKPEFANETFVHEGYSRPVVGGEMTGEDATFFRKHYPHAFSDSVQPVAEASAAEKPVDVVTDKPVVPQADLEKEQQAHAATKQRASETLKTEKDAHKATKDKLKEAEKQVKDLTASLEKLTKEVEKAADTVTEATHPTDGDAK